MYLDLSEWTGELLFHVNSHQLILEEEEFDNEVYRMTQFMNSHPLSPARMPHRHGGYALICLKLIYIWLCLSTKSLRSSD